MKKNFLLFTLVWASMAMYAQQLVLVPVENQQQLENVFQRQDLTPHYFNDEFAVATAKKCASDMILLDEAAFGDVEHYYWVCCPQADQSTYLKTQPLTVLYQGSDFLIVKASNGDFVPAKNDGAVAISNHKARLPRATRDFPQVTDENPDIRYLLDQVSQDSMRATVQHMQDYGSRKYNSQNVLQCVEWITDRFEALGLEVSQQPVTYSGSPTSPNVIAIQRGTLYPDTYVVCGSHHDSFSYSGNCPGADDNATGTASVLESARIMSQYQFDYSIIYCSFSCEEMGLIGSKAYAQACAAADMDIIGYFNNDMNGYLYGDAIHIHQIYPSSAEPCGAYYRNVGQAYFPEMVIEKRNFSSGDSDHTSFNNNGYQGIYPFEDVDHYSPYIHTSGDTIGTSVNGWLMPQRYCQMNIACLAEIAGMHARGPVVFQDYEITEDDNYNGRMNPGETVTMRITMKNVFDEAVQGVQVALVSNSPYIEVLDSNFDFGDFAPDEEKTVEGFRFRLSDEAPACVNYNLSLEAVATTASCTSSFSLMSYDYRLASDGVAVLSDDGFLQPGATATIRLLVSNTGNESAFQLTSTLTSDSEYLTINGGNESEVSILQGMTGYFDYNVTMSAEASPYEVLPLHLALQDVYGHETVVNFSLQNACNVIFTLLDSYGDGWNGASLEVCFSDSTPGETLTLSNGSSEVYTLPIGNGMEVSLLWHKGQWDIECSFSVEYENGDVIYFVQGDQAEGLLFSWVNDCSNVGGLFPEYCDGVRNLTINDENLLIQWETPDSGTPSAYEVYRGSDLIATTQSLSYQDTFNASGYLTYCVYPIYDECQGEMVCGTIFYETGVVEQEMNASVYPNPVKDQLTVAVVAPVTILVFNMQGQEVMHFTAQGEKTVDVSRLQAGLYTMKMVGDTVVTKKFVKE